MHRLSASRPTQNHQPICAELMKMAEQELAAFVSAVTELFGQEQAMASAEEWLEEVAQSRGLPASTRGWRLITVAVSARLANRVNALSMSA